MKDKKLTSILTELAEQSAPSAQVNLWPAVRSTVQTKQRQFHLGESKIGESRMNQTTVKNKKIRIAAIAAVPLILAMIFIAATPQGQAFAQSLFRFFTVTNQHEFNVPTEQVYTAPPTRTPAPAVVLSLEPYAETSVIQATPDSDPSCNSAESAQSYRCQMQAVEEQAGFDVLELPADPQGLTFDHAAYDPLTQEVTTRWVVTTGGGTLTLRQSLTENLPEDDPWNKIPTDAIRPVSVNGLYAEIAIGTYLLYPDATQAVWEPGGQIQLVWNDGKYWFHLDKMGEPYPIEWLTEEEMVKLADSLVETRPQDSETVIDLENLSSIAEAEQLAGVDILAPTLLPAGYELKQVMFTSGVVRLFYGSKNSTDNSLFIFMGPISANRVTGCPDCPAGSVEAVQIGPWSGWYWRGIYETTMSTPNQPTPTPIWDADEMIWSLDWNTDQLWISMWFAPGETGAEMNRDTLLAIAESMK